MYLNDSEGYEKWLKKVPKLTKEKQFLRPLKNLIHLYGNYYKLFFIIHSYKWKKITKCLTGCPFVSIVASYFHGYTIFRMVLELLEICTLELI